MRRGSWWWTAALLAAAFGCATPEGAAQDGGAEGSGSEEAAADEESEGPRRYRAAILERGKEEPFRVADAVLFVPEVSLFGGGGGERRRDVTLKRGAAEIEVPFHRIERIVVAEEQDDRLRVTLTLRPEEGEEAPENGRGPEELTGTVKASLQVRGTYADSGLATVVRLRQVLQVELEPVEKKG